jgi:PTH1 family peptidyl-tRNA hydrolase
VKLIVGLGNPGARYARTRHNVGFDVVDEVARRLRWSWEVGRGKAMIASGLYRAPITPPRVATRAGKAGNGEDAPDAVPEPAPPPVPVIREEKLLLAKPQTYMNESGVSVSELMRFYKLDRRDLLIICDDLDLPLGRMRIRARGAAGGQHGLESTIRLLGTSDFARLKIGIGRPAHGRDENVDFLLSQPRGDERITLDAAIERAADAALAWALEGAEAAMNRFNG